MYMCVNLPFGGLNPNPYPPHLTSTYTYGVTIEPRVCDGYITNIIPTFCPLVLDYYHLLKKKKKKFCIGDGHWMGHRLAHDDFRIYRYGIFMLCCLHFSV